VSEECFLVNDGNLSNGLLKNNVSKINMDESNLTLLILAKENESINATYFITNDPICCNFREIRIILPNDLKTNGSNSGLWQTIVGGVLAIIGGLLVAYWNAKNESKRNQFEWGKNLFDKYEKNYISFLADLTSTTSAITIEESYRKLCHSSLVPINLKFQIDETIKLLKDETLSQEEKELSRNNLINEVLKFMQSPWESS
jgi:hypothetical protein